MVKSLQRHYFAWMLLIPLLSGTSAYAQSFKPEQLRTSFLYHIVHYTKYPNEEFSQNQIRFCFFEGEKATHTDIFKQLPSKKIKNRDVSLFEVSSLDDLATGECQLLFVGKNVESEAVFAKLKELNRGLVSVGETRDFIERGGMITIVPLQSKMKIFLSREQYESTALKFSSLLLKRVNFR